MKKYHLLFIVLLGCISSSCWDENIPDAGANRPQVIELKSIPGDESIQLTWDTPEGVNPTDYIVFYTDVESEQIKLTTNGEKSIIVDNLVNNILYKFNVQAVYGKLISNPVVVEEKPSTSRFPITDLQAEIGQGKITLNWSKPSTGVLHYTLSYYVEDNPSNVEEIKIEEGDDVVSYSLSDLIEDKNYYISLVANYAKGSSEAATLRIMPSVLIPYLLSREAAAIRQPVTFNFNWEDYPEATDIKWTFPDQTVLTGGSVTSSFSSVGEQTVILTANIGSEEKRWNVVVNVREYVVFANNWETGGAAYNGFKGTAPVFSPDGKTVYIVTFNVVSALYAFDLDTGNEKWRYIPSNNSNSYNMLTVNPVTGDIYYGTTTPGQFYAVTPDGTLKWTFTEGASMQGAAPAVNKDGTVVYICDRIGNVFAIDATNGTKKWLYATGSISSGLLINGNDLIVGTQKDIYFLNTSNGALINQITPPESKGMVEITGFAVNNDKQVAYFSHRGGKMVSLDLNARAIKAVLSVATNDCYEPVVAPNGSVFVGSKDGNVYNLDKDLTKINWKHRHAEQSNTYNYSHPCVDANNRFYITSGGNALNTTYIFNSDGSVFDSWRYLPDDAGQLQMGGNNLLDGVIYSGMIGAGTSNGIFVGKYVGGERANSWSSHGGDICGTCCIQ